MKFTTILGSLALSALQVHASPVDAAAASPADHLEASTNENNDLYQALPKGKGAYVWNIYGCPVAVNRPDNGCNNWKFTIPGSCKNLVRPYTIGLDPNGLC
ncbi:hypothetical protein E4U43_002223 [Claviceps pusilla]|uniref:Uncharacterized protein n=1 Tax=Claviceps pusilla TaxID=123648 RepID=A0A9P7N7D8_9HYPO|nr:hypothetical protein E4U43_002223 [Claviceps pusilla]